MKNAYFAFKNRQNAHFLKKKSLKNLVIQKKVVPLHPHSEECSLLRGIAAEIAQLDKYLKIIAEKEGITKEEVQQEIGRAVSIALKSPDPKMQRFWTDFPCENDTPTIEEIIYHLAEKFAKES